jgi:hypothetical protein
MDLFDNPVGYRTSPGKMLRILLFLAEVGEPLVRQKLKFLNNSNILNTGLVPKPGLWKGLTFN